MSARMKQRWADPEYRAKTTRELLENRKVGGRLGVPDGMRKAEAMAKWAEAEAKAERIIAMLKENGELDEVAVPGSEAEMAEAALKEACKLALGPQRIPDKIAAIKVVLDFTKSRPESKSKLTVNKAEEWLAEISADMKKDDGRAD